MAYGAGAGKKTKLAKRRLVPTGAGLVGCIRCVLYIVLVQPVHRACTACRNKACINGACINGASCLWGMGVGEGMGVY